MFVVANEHNKAEFEAPIPLRAVVVCEALICKKALSVKIIGPLSPKALKCKKFGWPLNIIGLICKNDVGSNVLVQVHWHQRRD